MCWIFPWTGVGLGPLWTRGHGQLRTSPDFERTVAMVDESSSRLRKKGEAIAAFLTVGENGRRGGGVRSATKVNGGGALCSATVQLGHEEAKLGAGNYAVGYGDEICALFIGTGNREAGGRRRGVEWSIEPDGFVDGKGEGLATRQEPFLGGERRR